MRPALLSDLTTYSTASRRGSSVSISARIFGGDIGRSRSRIPIAAWIALATTAIGGRIGTSPTPRTPKGCRGFGTLDDHCIDQWQVGRDRHAIIKKPRVIETALLVVDVLLVERPADPLGDAALDLALYRAGMDGAADILRRGVAEHLHMSGLGIDFDIANMSRKRRPCPWASTDTSAPIGPPVRAALIAISANGSQSLDQQRQSLQYRYIL